MNEYTPNRKKRAKRTKQDGNYLNNNEFAGELDKWVIEYKKHKEEDTVKPTIPNNIIIMFKKIVDGYAKKPKFSGYTYIEDMKAEALLHCVKYIHNFDINKSTNAFAYFTQVIHNAFLQVLNKEKGYFHFKFDLNKEAMETDEWNNNKRLASRKDYNTIDLGY